MKKCKHPFGSLLVQNFVQESADPYGAYKVALQCTNCGESLSLGWLTYQSSIASAIYGSSLKMADELNKSHYGKS